MDTKLKKFNLSFLFKFIAVVLCLLCVGGSICQLSATLVMAEKRELQLENLEDALYTGSATELYETKSFKMQYNSYANRLLRIITAYGDGSEEHFNLKNEIQEKESTEKYERIRKNLISSIEQKNGFYDYLVYLDSSDIVNCGYIKTSDILNSITEYYDEDISDSDVSYGELSSRSYSSDLPYYEVPLTDDARKMMEETKADGVVLLPSSCDILDYDDSVIKNFPAGYYFFKVNDNALSAHLINESIITYDKESYKEFKTEYDNEQKYLQENFSSGRYFIKDSEGKVFTNVKGLSKKSSEGDLTEAFGKFGFYTRMDSYGEELVLPDGRYYTGIGYYSLYESDIFAAGKVYNYTDEIPEIYTTGMTQTTTLPSVTVPETTENNSVQTTAVLQPSAQTTVPATLAPTEPTTYHSSENYPVLTEKDSMEIYIGVDMHSESFKNEECRFSQVEKKITLARDMAKDCVKISGALVILFILLFIFLLVFSGRRFGDRENVYMLPGDRMFTDLRFILDCGLGFLTVMLIIGVLDEFFGNGNVNELIILLLGGLCALFALIVLDLVLFITRHIKNKTLFKRASAVWLVRKLSEKTGKVFKTDMRNKLLNVLLVLFIPVNVFIVFLIWGVCNNEFELVILMTALVSFDLATLFLLFKEKKWINPIKEKMKYVRGFEKETVIKGAIVLGVNFILGLLSVIELTNTETLWFAFALIGFDIFVAIQLIRFIAGVKKIFSAVNELKEGNYDVQINLFSIPSSLHEPANKLMNLRDGLKAAVEEAVKQEQTKTELITNVSHDLKTPLTSIINYVELLKKCDITDGNAKEYLSVLGEKSDRLKKLIEDLVEASKASTGNLKVELMEVSLNEITKQIIGEFSDNFDEKGLTLVETIPEEDITVKADSKMLYRVLENLMSNVSKYAMENTRVYLSVERKQGRGVISLKNISGSPLNITAEELKARFVRGDEARSTDGNGLGLSIAESLCDIQGGKLNIEINGDLFVAEVEISIN